VVEYDSAVGQMTVPQAAAAIGMHRTRLWQLVRDGKVKAEKTGRDWLIAAEEVERLKSLPIPARGRPRSPRRPPVAPEEE